MEYESLQNPDPEDVLAQPPLTDDPPGEIPELLPIADRPLGIVPDQPEGASPDSAPAVLNHNGFTPSRFSASDRDDDETDEDDVADEFDDDYSDLDRLAQLDPAFVTDPVRLYLREISKAPLLKGEQELDLAHKIARATSRPHRSLCWPTFAWW